MSQHHPLEWVPLARVKQEKLPVPPLGEDSWKAGALALLATLTPAGQQAALTAWAKLKPPFCPALPEAPALPLPEASALLADFTVLDLEFQPQPAALLELAAIRYRNWQPVGKLVSFVQCRAEINPHVAKLTGITRADVFNAPPEKQVLQQFLALAGGSVLVAHNALAADKKQLELARTRCGATAPLPNPWLCTLALARQRRPKGAGCGLGELALDFGISAVGAHRALRDVEMCYQVLRHFQAQQPLTQLLTSLAAPKAARTGDLFSQAA